MDTSQHATQKRQEEASLEKGVDLSRRRLFAWADSKSKQQSPSADTHSVDVKAAKAPITAEEALSPVVKPQQLSELIVKHIHQISIEGELTCRTALPALFADEPLLIPPNMSGDVETTKPDEWQLLENPRQLSTDKRQQTIAKTMQIIAEQTKYSDIIEVQGKKDTYYYTTQHMADNYAHMLVLMLEKDHCATIAEMVRFESKTYPRPYEVEALQNQPFFLSSEQISAALKVMATQAPYSDIQSVQASNNALYLYSNLHMLPAAAQGLCEWLEVEQFDNP